MVVELLVSLLGAGLSLAAGGLTTTELAQRIVRTILRRKAPSQPTYSERLTELTASLKKSSEQVDAVLAELAQVAQERERGVRALETNLAGLEGREQALKQSIADLQRVPLPAVEHFAKMVESGEKSSAWRDYILFGAGVIVSTIIAIGLKFLGLG